MSGLPFDAGSYRDRTSRVFRHDGAVFRALGAEALEAWEALSGSAFFRRSVAEGRVIRTERVAAPPGVAGVDGWRAFLRHAVVPFVSYPYEWPFGMLKDAALLYLDLLLEGLDEELVLRDGSPFNVQWVGARPVFIDVPSFRRLRPGELWVGYRQFCEMFLYPLFLTAYRDVPFHPWLRGRLDGISAEECANLLSGLDRLRPAVLVHAYLHAKLQARFAGTDVPRAPEAAGLTRQAVIANVRRLRRTVARLAWRRSRSAWSEYGTADGYDEADRDRKAAFVRGAVRARPRRLVWDLGCNTGLFARVAAEHADYVVAMDADHLAVERLYRALGVEGRRSILPLVVNLADASPGLGWRGRERRPLADRGAPDLTLCLALIHHLVIGAGLPLDELIAHLAGLGGDLVIEFVDRDDPMTLALLRRKDEPYADYRLDHFERCLSDAFRIEGRETLGRRTRVLYYARGRGA